MEPNILFIMGDQLNHRFLPWAENSIVRAPHLASLAKRGTVFKNAYCNYPICAPSRYSMLTGFLPHSISAWDNAAELSSAIPTIGHALTQRGYETILCGKMHFVGPDQKHGFTERLVTDIYPADFAWVPNWDEGPRNAPTGISMRAVIEAGHCQRSLQLDYDDEVEYFASQKLFDLRRQATQDPFFLCVSFTHPHSPFTAPKEFWDLYDPSEIDMPRVGEIPFDELDTHSKWLYYSHGRDQIKIKNEHIRDARHAYYGMVSYLDSKVGRLINLLDSLAFDRDILIIFCSDHGEMMGERGMWFKQTFFEDSVRVPLFIGGSAWKGAKGHSERLCSLIDLVPTLLEITNSEKYWVDDLPGKSLLAKATEESTSVISEYSDMGVCAPCRMLRKGRYKYWITHGHASQLYDLTQDPQELNNLAGIEKYHSIEETLFNEIYQDWDPKRIHKEILTSQKRRRLIQASRKLAKDSDNWSFEVQRNDQFRYVRGGGDKEGTVATKRLARFPPYDA